MNVEQAFQHTRLDWDIILKDGKRTIVDRHYSDKGGHKERSDYHKAHRKQGLKPKRDL